MALSLSTRGYVDMSITSKKVLVSTHNLVKHFPIFGGLFRRETARVHAVNGVSLDVFRGETVGLVGESGCGKTTLGKTIVRLYKPDSGTLFFDGIDITSTPEKDLATLRRRFQIIFQDPYASLNPRMTVADTLAEAIGFHHTVPKSQIPERIAELMSLCGLRPELAHRFPHEFSGGQRQRIGIARALSVEPEFVMADEPVSALDVSIQAQLLNLLADLRERLHLTVLFVSHDLKVVQHFCDRVVVMYLGRIVEILPATDLETEVLHPYSKALLSALPKRDPTVRTKRIHVAGEVPSPIDLPSGCTFRGRCALARPECADRIPELVSIRPNHAIACPVVTQS